MSSARSTPLIVVVLWTVAACGGNSGAGSTSPPTSAADPRPATVEASVPAVTVASPTAARLEAIIEAPGTLNPFEEAALSAEAAGTVTEVRIDEGSRVRRGEVLVRQDTAKAELAVKQAQASLALARANFDKAKSELGRKEQLLADQTIAPGTFETFKAQYEAAQASIDAAESSLALARRRLQDLTAVAPFDGVVRQKSVTLGEYVREGGPLLVLMRVDPLKLTFELPEKYAGRVSLGQTVTARVVALPGESFTGTVRIIAPAMSVQSRSISVEAQLPNRTYRLKPGFFASVQVPLSSLADSLIVPRSAIVRWEGTENVYVVRNGRAELARVETGVETADAVEVVSGLAQTDQVVISGGASLHSGDRVRIGGQG